MKLTVKEIAEARGFKNAKQLADAAGIHYKSMYTIWSGDAQLISMDVLGRLCTTLRVQVGLLFEIVPDAEADKPDKPAKPENKRSRVQKANNN